MTGNRPSGSAPDRRELVGVADPGRLDFNQHLAGARPVEVDRFDDQGFTGFVTDAARVFIAGLSGGDSSSVPGRAAIATFRRSPHRNATNHCTRAGAPATMSYPFVISLRLAYAFSAVALGSRGRADISKVNGSVRIEAGQVAGDVSTVNGSITIGSEATVDEVETVNGSLTIGDRAKVALRETSTARSRSAPAPKLRTVSAAVNGSMTLGQGARIGGGLETSTARCDSTGPTSAAASRP
jgi:hypothetical protein